MLPQPTGAVEAQEGCRTEDGHHQVILAIPRPFLAQTLEEWFDAPSPVVPSEEEAKISVGCSFRSETDRFRTLLARYSRAPWRLDRRTVNDSHWGMADPSSVSAGRFSIEVG